jgi:hypothetical protein
MWQPMIAATPPAVMAAAAGEAPSVATVTVHFVAISVRYFGLMAAASCAASASMLLSSTPAAAYRAGATFATPAPATPPASQPTQAP